MQDTISVKVYLVCVKTDDDDSKSDDDTVFESTTDLRQSFVAALKKKGRKETLNSMW